MAIRRWRRCWCPTYTAAMGRVYGGRSADDRLRERRERLIAAAIQLIGTRGLAQTTVRAVCREAKLSSRFFYESFDGVDALAVAAYDACVESAVADMFPRVAAVDPDPKTQALTAMRLLVEYLEREPERSRLMFVESVAAGPLASRRRGTVALLAGTVMSLAPEPRGARGGRAQTLQIAARLVAGGVAELLLGTLDGTLDVSSERLVEDGAVMLVAVGEAAGVPAHAPGDVA